MNAWKHKIKSANGMFESCTNDKLAMCLSFSFSLVIPFEMDSPKLEMIHILYVIQCSTVCTVCHSLKEGKQELGMNVM